MVWYPRALGDRRFVEDVEKLFETYSEQQMSMANRRTRAGSSVATDELLNHVRSTEEWQNPFNAWLWTACNGKIDYKDLHQYNYIVIKYILILQAQGEKYAESYAQKEFKKLGILSSCSTHTTIRSFPASFSTAHWAKDSSKQVKEVVPALPGPASNTHSSGAGDAGEDANTGTKTKRKAVDVVSSYDEALSSLFSQKSIKKTQRKKPRLEQEHSPNTPSLTDIATSASVTTASLQNERSADQVPLQAAKSVSEATIKKPKRTRRWFKPRNAQKNAPPVNVPTLTKVEDKQSWEDPWPLIPDSPLTVLSSDNGAQDSPPDDLADENILRAVIFDNSPSVNISKAQPDRRSNRKAAYLAQEEITALFVREHDLLDSSDEETLSARQARTKSIVKGTRYRTNTLLQSIPSHVPAAATQEHPIPAHETAILTDPLVLPQAPPTEWTGGPEAPVVVEQCLPPINKLPLASLPPIWAQSRQEVCESFDWFRSFQGGVYFSNGLAKGYLLGGFSASRDIFAHGGKMIISHGGGKAAESIAKSEVPLEAGDQLEDDKSVKALLQTKHMKRPLALIIDDNYALFPFNLGSKECTYAVLGWYYIAHAWAEYQPGENATGRVVRYKFAFQWCEGQGNPWWNELFAPTTPSLSFDSSGAISPSEPLPEEIPMSTDCELYQGCKYCGCESPHVYQESWMCLRPNCRAFWKMKEDVSQCSSLTYTPQFLQPLPFPVRNPGDIRPLLPAADWPNNTATTSQHFLKGWHCRLCGRLSSRYKWEYWECSNCKSTHKVLGRVRLATEFFGQRNLKSWDKYWYNSKGIEGVEWAMFKCERSHGQRITFCLPHGRGKIHVLAAQRVDTIEADDIFGEYQVQAARGTLQFQRYPLRTHRCRGTLLSGYFSHNAGEPYQYVGGAENTVPFDSCPSSVLNAMGLIKKRINQAGLNIPADFNEILSAAYMEKQKMGFHSDSERGLGPTVSSLSLGSTAYMHFRLHNTYAAELPSGGSREVLTLFLRHGDVLVMDGADVQQYYEHMVVPVNFRIAATARFIGSDHC